MQLNLSIYDQLDRCENLLIAGMGGGFDIYCGLPIYFEMKKRGKIVHLANLSFVEAWAVEKKLSLTKYCNGVSPESLGPAHYCPECYLSRYLKKFHDEDVTIWQMERMGSVQLMESYLALIDRLSIDGILLVDGGVDSLVQGDEVELGTPLEDFASLYVVNKLDQIPVRLMACAGFGAEREVHHTHILENIATLTKSGAFLGSCSLLKQMESVQHYIDALHYVQNQDEHVASVINSSVVSAIEGEYGDFHLTERTRGGKLWINPLMAMYWFFDVVGVAAHNKLLDSLAFTDNRNQIFRKLTLAVAKIDKQRPRMKIPLV